MLGSTGIKYNMSPCREGLSVDISALAKEVFNILNAPANPLPCTPVRQQRKKSQFFINTSNKKAKSVTLHIQGLDSAVSRLTDTTTHTHSYDSDCLWLLGQQRNNNHVRFSSRTSEACVRRLSWRSEEWSASPSRWLPRDVPSVSAQTCPLR